MNADPRSPSTAEVIDEVSKWGVGAGIVAVALAPLAIPIVVLTLATLVLLAVPAIPLVLIAGLVYLPVRAVRGLRARRRGLRGGAAEEEVLVGVELAPAHHRLVE
jgi:hypothetical protein